MTQAYRIRSMEQDEMGLALDWAAAEGWNPGLHDAPCFHAADPGAFLVGLLGDEPVATISVVRYGADTGFLGFYIVRPGFRGRGLGLEIWQAGKERLAGRQVGLDGVPAQQDNYRKSGFTLAWRNIRHERPGSVAAPKDDRIVQLSALQFDTVLAYDQAFFPADRSVFLRTNLHVLALAQRHGMTAMFETARMDTGPAPAMPLERFYGVTSYELG